MSTTTTTPAPVHPSSTARVRIFVDYWNLQLTLNEQEAAHKGSNRHDERFKIDFLALPGALIAEASSMLKCTCSYEGMHIYTSANPSTAQDRKYQRWVTSWLDRQPGIQVTMFERQRKRPPTCRQCHTVIAECPSCSESLSGTVEKGVDSAIVTDMIRLAWEKAYDVGIIVSSDSDLVPAVEFLDSRSLKFLQAGFPPIGSDLATTCWASFDLFAIRDKFRRK